MDIKWLGVTFLFGVVAGAFLRGLFNKPELNTDVCMDYLKERGYFVNLNSLPTKK